MSKEKIVYPDARMLRTGDILDCDGGPDAFSKITRMVTGPKGQNIFQRIRNHDIATHTGIIVEWAKQRFVAEMRPNGLEPNAIEFYRTPFAQSPRRIIAVHRPIIITDKYREILNESISLDIRRGIEYATKDLPRFISLRIKADKKRMYCSEYAYFILKGVLSTGNGVNLIPDAPVAFDNLVSPESLSRYCKGSINFVEIWNRAKA